MVLGDLVVALAVLLVYEFDGDGAGILEAGIEVGEDVMAQAEGGAPNLDGLDALNFPP